MKEINIKNGKVYRGDMYLCDVKELKSNANELSLGDYYVFSTEKFGTLKGKLLSVTKNTDGLFYSFYNEAYTPKTIIVEKNKMLSYEKISEQNFFKVDNQKSPMYVEVYFTKRADNEIASFAKDMTEETKDSFCDELEILMNKYNFFAK